MYWVPVAVERAFFISQVQNLYSNLIRFYVIEGNVLLLTCYAMQCFESCVLAVLAVFTDQQKTKVAFDSFQMLAN